MSKIRYNRSLAALALLLALLLSLILPAHALGYENSKADLDAARSLIASYSFFDLTQAAEQAKSMDELMSALFEADPYAHYLTAEDLADNHAQYFGTYVGIGILMELNADRNVAVRCVYGDTIAAKAELRRGDVIYSVNGVSTLGKSVEQVQELLAGQDGSIFTLVIQRGENRLTMDIKRTKMATPSMYYWVEEGGVGYLKITRFSSATDEQLAAALKYLPELGATSLLLDLRDCPGGLMDAAADCCAMLTTGGPIFYQVDKTGYRSIYTAKDYPVSKQLPLAVLVNKGTASAAEMTAAVIQDAAAGTVIGSGTYGKGYYQTLLSLPSGASLYLTIGKYVTWGRQDIAEQGGVTPDQLVADAEQQYAAAAAWLKVQQAVPAELRFQANQPNAQADGAAWTLAAPPLNQGGRTYAGAVEVLTKLGWNLNYYQGKCYAFNGMRRLIFDPADGAMSSGKHTDQGLVLNQTVYLPLSFLAKVGYDVSWDAASGSVVVARK